MSYEVPQNPPRGYIKLKPEAKTIPGDMAWDSFDGFKPLPPSEVGKQARDLICPCRWVGFAKLKV